MLTTQEAWTEYQQISQLEEQLRLLKSMLCDMQDETKACALGSAVRIMDAYLEQRVEMLADRTGIDVPSLDRVAEEWEAICRR